MNFRFSWHLENLFFLLGIRQCQRADPQQVSRRMTVSIPMKFYSPSPGDGGVPALRCLIFTTCQLKMQSKPHRFSWPGSIPV